MGLLRVEARVDVAGTADVSTIMHPQPHYASIIWVSANLSHAFDAGGTGLGPVRRIMAHVSSARFAAGGVLVLDLATARPTSSFVPWRPHASSDESGSKIR